MGTDHGTGWERNKRTHFDEIVMNYDKVRWGYPSKLFDDVISYTGPEKGKKALEIGAGEKYYNSYYISKGKPVRKPREDYTKPSEIYRGFLFESLERYGFSEITMKLYDASRSYSADEYLALLDTFADHRGLPDENRTALYTGIKAAIVRHGGHHKVDYVYQLYMGRKL